MSARARGAFIGALPGLLMLIAGIGVIALPWWATSVPAKLHPASITFARIAT